MKSWWTCLFLLFDMYSIWKSVQIKLIIKKKKRIKSCSNLLNCSIHVEHNYNSRNFKVDLQCWNNICHLLRSVK